MSIWLSVGWAEPEDFEIHNKALRAVGLPEHQEPELYRPGLPWRKEIGGYGCFYHLRRVAAYSVFDQGLPEPTLDFDVGWKDRLLQRYYQEFAVEKSLPESGSEEQGEAWIGRSAAPFAHLMHHSEPFGDYIPMPFPEIIVVYPPHSGWQGPRGIGSSHRLLEECRELAQRLQFPADIALQELDRVRRTDDYVRQADWTRLALECFVCKALMVGAELSIDSGRVLHFG